MLKLNMIALSLFTTALAPVVVAQSETEEKVYLEADTLTDDRDNGQLIAEGGVIARFETRELRADRIVYFVDQKIVRASGNVRITDADGSVRFADEIEVDDRLGDGVATEFSAQLPQNATIVARAVSRKANGSNTLDKAVYTACKVCEENNYTPVWSLRARKAEQNTETQMITYKDAVFEIKGVPVLYIPYFAHPDPSTERRSGFLMPTPGLSSKLGFVYEQPYYWAISKSQDMTITPRLHTNVNPTLGLQYRKRFYSGQVEADMSFAYDYMFDSNGDRQFFNSAGGIVEDPANYTGTLFPSEQSLRSHIYANGSFDINEDWRWGFGVSRVTDDLYLRRYGIEDRRTEPGIYDVTGNVNLSSYLFATRQTEDSYLDATLLSVQSLQANVDDSTLPIATPIAFAEKNIDYGNLGIVTLQGSAALLERDVGDDTRRVSASASWQNTYVAPAGLVVEPELRGRLDYYDYSIEATSTTPQIDDTQTRSSVMASTTLRWPLINRQKDFDMIVEPIVTAAWSDVSIENGQLPNEDSQIYEYTMAVAFEPDPFTNFDLIENGARLAAGFRSQVDFRNGVGASAALARRWKDQADPAFTFPSNLSGEKSDYLFNGEVNFGETFRLGADLRYDDDFNLNRTEVNGSLDWWRLSATAKYFDVNPAASLSGVGSKGVEGISIRSLFDLTDSIQLGYTQTRDISLGLDLSRSFGIKLHDDCGFIALTYVEQDALDRGLGTSESIKLSFGLKTLGVVSDDTFD